MSAGCNSQGMLGRLTSTVAFGVTNPTQTNYRDPLFGFQISKTFLAKKTYKLGHLSKRLQNMGIYQSDIF